MNVTFQKMKKWSKERNLYYVFSVLNITNIAGPQIPLKRQTFAFHAVRYQSLNSCWSNWLVLCSLLRCGHIMNKWVLYHANNKLLFLGKENNYSSLQCHTTRFTLFVWKLRHFFTWVNFSGMSIFWLVGTYFCGQWLVALRCKIIFTLFNIRGDVNSWVRVTQEIYEHWFPTNNNDSIVISCMKNYNVTL